MADDELKNDELNIPRNASEAVAQRQLDERIAFSAELAKQEDPVNTEATMGAIADIIHDRIGYPVGETSSSEKHDTVKLPSEEGGLSFVSVFGGTPAMRAAAIDSMLANSAIEQDLFGDGGIKAEGESANFDPSYDPSTDTSPIERSTEREWEELTQTEQARMVSLIGAAVADLMSVFKIKPVMAQISLMSQSAFEAQVETDDANAEANQRPLSAGDRVLMELNKAAHDGTLRSMQFQADGGLSMAWDR